MKSRIVYDLCHTLWGYIISDQETQPSHGRGQKHRPLARQSSANPHTPWRYVKSHYQCQL